MTPTQQPYDEWMQNMERLEKEATSGPWIPGLDTPIVYQTAHITRDIWIIARCHHLRTDAKFIAASRQFIPRALEELRKRDRAIEIAKKSIRCTCEFHKIHGSDGPCNGCVALQQIEEVLK